MDTLEQAQAAIDAGELDNARDLLRPVLQDEPSAQAWYLAAQAAVNERQRRAFLEKAIELDPLHARAGIALHALDHPQQPAVELTAPPPPRPATAPAPAQTDANPVTASFARRAGAFFTDQLLLTIIIYPLMIVLANTMLGDSLSFSNQVVMRFTAIFLAFNVLIQGSFYAYYLAARGGQTPGKRLFGIRVVKRDGRPLTIWDAILRSLVGYALSAMALGVGFFWAEFDARSQTWHDMVADTLVVPADS